MTLDNWLARQHDRCRHGFDLRTQHPDLCACKGERLRDVGQAIATAAHPDDRAKVEAAIRRLAATGRPFSANDARQIHGIKGGVVGAAFTALHKAGVIQPVGDERSTEAGTHGHRIFKWQGAAA